MGTHYSLEDTSSDLEMPKFKWALPLTSILALSKGPNFSVPPFSHSQVGDDNGACQASRGLLEGLSE